MKGIYGLGLIALGVFIAIMGGFILNAETVSTCETEWEYLTDMGAAFQGTDSDMEVEYNPSENITGWSAFDEPNEGWISGVQPEFTDLTNAYRVFTGSRAYTTYSIGFNADDHDGTTLEPQYRLSVDSLRFTDTMPTGFGYHNSELLTAFEYGTRTAYGCFACPLSAVANVIPDWSNLGSIVIAFNSSTAGYPCFAWIDGSATGVTDYEHGGVSYSPLTYTYTAKAYSPTVAIDVVTGSATIDGSTVSMSQVTVVWGRAQFNGSGDYRSYHGATGTGTLAVPSQCIDAPQGVLVSEGTVSWTEMSYTTHSGSSSPSMELAFTSEAEESVCDGTISYVLPGLTEAVEVASFTFAGSLTMSGTSLTPTGGTAYSSTISSPSSTISMTMSGGIMTFLVNGGAAGTYTVSYPSGYDSLGSLVIEWSQSVTGPWPSFTAVVTKDDSNADSFEGSSAATYTADLSYTTYSPTEQSEDYDTTYWYNGQMNSELTLVLRYVAYPTSALVTFRGPDGSTAVDVVYTTSGWTVNGTSIGKFTAIELTVDHGTITVVPIVHFRSFFDYVTVDTVTTVVQSGAVGGGAVESMSVTAGSTGVYKMKACVVSTTAFIEKGGLFLQDASMSLQTTIPGSKAVSVMLGSAAATGTGITFTSGSSSVTLEVDPDSRQILVGETWYPFNGVTFRWYSTTGDSAIIDDTTYGPAIYYRGQTYAAGKIWAEVSGGKMIEILGASEDWTMTLDGVWVPAVFMYLGTNVASSSVEIADFMHGEFRWDSNTFIVVLMAVSVVGGLIGSYFKLVDLWDWAAIFGTVVVLWIILG